MKIIGEYTYGTGDELKASKVEEAWYYHSHRGWIFNQVAIETFDSNNILITYRWKTPVKDIEDMTDKEIEDTIGFLPAEPITDEDFEVPKFLQKEINITDEEKIESIDTTAMVNDALSKPNPRKYVGWWATPEKGNCNNWLYQIRRSIRGDCVIGEDHYTPDQLQTAIDNKELFVSKNVEDLK